MEVAEAFISCKKEAHDSREFMLPLPVLCRLISGDVRIAASGRSFHLFADNNIPLPKDQLGRMTKLSLKSESRLTVSIVSHNDHLKNYCSIQPLVPRQVNRLGFSDHPLLQSLFNSLQPYFDLANALPPNIAALKVEETIWILRAIAPIGDGLLGHFEAPGKCNLGAFIAQNFIFNFPLRKFSYLKGRSLTTFKKDFKSASQETPGHWLTQKRLELVRCQILAQKRKPSEVYLGTGFEDFSDFSFAFKSILVIILPAKDLYN